MSLLNNKKSRILEVGLRTELFHEDTIACLKAALSSSSTSISGLGNSNVEIIRSPFPVCLIHNFISNSELLKSVLEELKNVTFHQKSNDLYQFQQSDDLQNITNFSFVPQLYSLVRNEGLNFVEKVIDNIKLNKEISATFSCYKFRDRLLCHDDKCEDRHIAFILYLVEDWKSEDGGALELFSVDRNGYPVEVVNSITPEFNTFVFFEVTHYSFHQVAEVLTNTKERFSLNGWFHSSEKKYNNSNCKILEFEKTYGNDKNFNFEEYFLFTYLDYKNKVDIKKIFATESEIELQEFLVPKFWEELEKDLRSNKVEWTAKGPANIRKYEVAKLSSLPSALQKLKEIFESKCWFKYLRTITGLDLAPSETSNLEIWERGSASYCNFEIQKWTHSCYTVIHDKDPEFHSEALDVILRIPFDDNQNLPIQSEDYPGAGHIVYIDADSKNEECLLHIGYKMNSLAMIFRDVKTLRFTKYLDSTAAPFFLIFCTYRPWKPPLDEPSLKHCEDDSESEESISENEIVIDSDSN